MYERTLHTAAVVIKEWFAPDMYEQKNQEMTFCA